MPMEWLLVAAVILFYLQDSARLLYFDEVLVVPLRRGWRVGSEGALEVSGRFLSVPSPLLPHRVAFRAGWLVPSDGRAEPDALRARLRPLRPVQMGCWVVALLLLVALPMFLLQARTPVAMLALLCAVYGTIAGLAAYVVVARARLGLDARRALGMAVEVLLCPPYAINLARRVCLAGGFPGDPLAFAARVLDAEARDRLARALEARLDLFALADDGVQRDTLASRRATLRETLA